MADKAPIRPFPHAGADISTTRAKTPTPQTRSASYRLAFADDDFLLTDELRGTRLMLEYLKPELALRAHGVKSTVVVFGSTRISDPDAQPPSGERRPALERDYYREARRFAALLATQNGEHEDLECVIMTGGGPGIMEAANRGAADVGAKSIGLNIVLPREQVPNPWITPELTFQFHYFALRKLHFLLRAKALVAFPGGFGTLDELFEALTLLQTRRIHPMPVLLFGEAFWRRIVDFDAMVELGVIAREDRDLFRFVETAEQAVAWIRDAGRAPGPDPK
ncbi:MAG TPA: LOG family protein [Gammaproteobacteria bacterium]|jgi:uncharacterized protein (TIGR00730 family)